MAYAIGKAHPVGFYVECFGTEKVPVDQISDAVLALFDLRPAAIIRDLDLIRPIYAQTAAYGHFGREPARTHLGEHRPGRRPGRRRQGLTAAGDRTVRHPRAPSALRRSGAPPGLSTLRVRRREIGADARR